MGNDYTLSFITSFIKSETHLPKNKKKKMKKWIFCPPSYIYRYIWFVHFSFFLSIHIWVRSINKHQSHPCNISVQNSNDKKCIDRKKKLRISETKLDFLKNQFNIGLRFKILKNLSEINWLFIITIIWDHVSVRAYTSIFYHRKNTMELNVFYCTMHNSIDIFLLLHVIRSCHEMTIIVSYIDSAPFLKQLQIIASSVFIYFVKMISFFIFLP